MPTNIRQQAWNNALSVKTGNFDRQIATSEIIGTVPASLRGGRLLSNGPGWNKYGEQVIHPFDGHGYLREVQFLEDGSVTTRGRFIETEAYQIESVSNQFEIRGFATNPSKHFWQNIGFGKPRNVANTTIYRWNNQLLAGWEGGTPHAIDPISLETLGLQTFGGVIANQTTLAHMGHDHEQNRLIVGTTKMGKDTTLCFHEFDPQNQQIASRQGKLEGAAFVHDFTFTPNWYVVGGNPLSIDYIKAGKAFLGSGTLLTSVRANTDKTGELVLISRHDNQAQRRIKLPKPAFVVHFANAFEQPDGTLIVDACIFHDFPFGEEFGYTGRDTPFDPTLPEKRGPQTLYRIRIAPDATEGCWQKLTEHGVDFPRVTPQHAGHDVPFIVGATRADTRFSDPFDSLFCLDLTTTPPTSHLWTTTDTTFVGEPIPVADPHTGDTYVLVVLTDGKTVRKTKKVCIIPCPF